MRRSGRPAPFGASESQRPCYGRLSTAIDSLGFAGTEAGWHSVRYGIIDRLRRGPACRFRQGLGSWRRDRFGFLDRMRSGADVPDIRLSRPYERRCTPEPAHHPVGFMASMQADLSTQLAFHISIASRPSSSRSSRTAPCRSPSIRGRSTSAMPERFDRSHGSSGGVQQRRERSSPRLGDLVVLH